MWAERSEKEQDRAEILLIGGMTTSRTTRHWSTNRYLPQSQLHEFNAGAGEKFSTTGIVVARKPQELETCTP